jgi:solute:Na+ symporter, SSS family
VLCLGGNDATQARAEVFEIVVKAGRLSLRHELPPLPVASTMGCAALVGDVVIFASGESGGRTHRRAFQLALNQPAPQWQELPWPAEAPGRILAVSGVHDGQFYLFSGCDLGAPTWDKRLYLKDAWAYRPADSRWQRLADLPESAAAGPSGAVASGLEPLRLFGGVNRPFVEIQRAARPATEGNGLAHPGFPTSILAYHPQSDSWTTSGHVPHPAPVTTTRVRWRGRIVIPTGEIKPGIRSPQVLSFR